MEVKRGDRQGVKSEYIISYHIISYHFDYNTPHNTLHYTTHSLLLPLSLSLTSAFSASVIDSSLAASIIIATFPLSAALGVPGRDRVALLMRRCGVWRVKELPVLSLGGTIDPCPCPERRGEICDDTTRVLCRLRSDSIARESLKIPGSVTLGPGRPGNIPSSSVSPSLSSLLSLLLLRLL